MDDRHEAGKATASRAVAVRAIANRPLANSTSTSLSAMTPSPANHTTATIAREFAGSRVERQILAQVFDLLCKGRRGDEPIETVLRPGHDSRSKDCGRSSRSAMKGGAR